MATFRWLILTLFYPLCSLADSVADSAKSIEILAKQHKPKIVVIAGTPLPVSLPESTQVYQVTSLESLRGIQPDLLFLHWPNLTVEELKLWQAAVRQKGGILAGAPWSGAVEQFAQEQGLAIRKLKGCWCYKEPTPKPYPIGFSIPACKIVPNLSEKDQDFARIIPKVTPSFLFEEEVDYYRDYQRSYFAVTCKKGGWDCMRHYEILANGCIPYFVDLESCEESTLPFLPKQLILEAMHLEGVSYLHIDHQKFNRAKYEVILLKLLDYTRTFLTTEKMAKYLLDTLRYSGKGKILFLSNSEGADYLRCLTLIGLKEKEGDKVIDVPKIPHIYRNYPGEVKHSYGRGMSYTKIVEDLPIDREAIAERIKKREFELIIYGSIHKGLPFYDLVLEHYEGEKIAYLCGEDWHVCGYAHLKNFFIREYDAAFPLLKQFPDPQNMHVSSIGAP